MPFRNADIILPTVIIGSSLVLIILCVLLVAWRRRMNGLPSLLEQELNFQRTTGKPVLHDDEQELLREEKLKYHQSFRLAKPDKFGFSPLALG
eukprot:m.336984 g.336984  ORF g.336984 m.336984 type:complete len:93 (-) comp18011_c0_seq1:246-524(-)